jgi:hypothetical protein
MHITVEVEHGHKVKLKVLTKLSFSVITPSCEPLAMCN